MGESARACQRNDEAASRKGIDGLQRQSHSHWCCHPCRTCTHHGRHQGTNYAHPDSLLLIATLARVATTHAIVADASSAAIVHVLRVYLLCQKCRPCNNN